MYDRHLVTGQSSGQIRSFVPNVAALIETTLFNVTTILAVQEDGNRFTSHLSKISPLMHDDTH